MALKTIEKKVVSYCEIPEGLIPEKHWINQYELGTHVECHIDDAPDDELSAWLREIYPELIDEESFYIYMEKSNNKDTKSSIINTWQEIHFRTQKGSYSAEVELTVNHKLGTFDLQTIGEEAVSFKRDSLEVAKLRLEAISEALDWVEKNLSFKEK